MVIQVAEGEKVSRFFSFWDVLGLQVVVFFISGFGVNAQHLS